MFKINLLFVLGLLIQTTTHAQSKDFLLATALYKVTVVRNGIKGVDDICELKIGKKNSYFFSKRERDNRNFIEDKVAKATATNSSLNFERGEIITNYYRYSTIFEHNEKTAIVLEDFGSNIFGYKPNNLNVESWKITQDTLTINKLFCRKAVLKRDTTSIDAWFCTDIPFKDGPFSYFGLPGLIIKLKTTNGSEAILTEIKFSSNQLQTFELPKYTLITSDQMMKARENRKFAPTKGISTGGTLFKIEKKEN